MRHIILSCLMLSLASSCSQVKDESANRFPLRNLYPHIAAALNSTHSNLLELAKSNCADEDCIAQAKYLLSKGANLEETGEWGWTPLPMAIAQEKMKLADFFLSSGANHNLIVQNERGGDFFTPLSLTVFQLPYGGEMISRLLEFGANPNLIPDDALILKGIKANIQIKQLTELVQHGADQSLTQENGFRWGIMIHEVGPLTPLLMAAYYGRFQAFELFNVAPNRSANAHFGYVNGLSALDLAFLGSAQWNYEEHQAIIDHIQSSNSFAPTNTTLYTAVFTGDDYGNNFIFEALQKDPGLSVDEVLTSGSSAAMVAIERGNFKFLEGMAGSSLSSIVSAPANSAKDNSIGDIAASDSLLMMMSTKKAMCTIATAAYHFPESLNPPSSVRSPLFRPIETLADGVSSDSRRIAESLIRLMMACGANANLKGPNGLTPLQVAARNPDLSALMRSLSPDRLRCSSLLRTYRNEC